MSTIWQDVRYAVRTLSRQPGFTLVAIGTLALGIGANTAIFSMVDAVVMRGLPYPDADRLAVVWTTSPPLGSGKGRTDGMDFQDWRAQSETFQDLTLLGGAGFYVTDPGEIAVQLPGAVVMPNYFSVLGVTPVLGRVFTDEDNHADAPRVAILSHALWTARFAADPNVIGRSITINGAATTIVGVMPTLPFPISAPTSADMPLSCFSRHLWMPVVQSQNCMPSRNCHVYVVFGRLRPGVTIEQAQTEMSGIARRLEEEYPATNTGDGVLVVPMHEEVTEGVRTALVVLLGAVGLVLLMGERSRAGLTLAAGPGERGSGDSCDVDYSLPNPN